MLLFSKLVPRFSLSFILLCSFNYKSEAQIAKDTIPAFAYFQKADSLSANKKFEASIEVLKKALPIYEKANAWERVADCHNKMAKSFFKNRQYDQIVTHLNKVLALVPNKLSPNSLAVAESYYVLGQKTLMKELDYVKCLELYNKSLRIKEIVLERDDVRFVKIYEKIAIVLNKLGKFDEALNMVNKGIAIKKKVYGENDYRTVTNLYIVIDIYRKKGELYNALNTIKSGIEILKKKFGEAPNMQLANLYINLGIIHNELNYISKGLYYTNKSLEIKSQLVDKNSGQLTNDYNNLGISYFKSGRHEEALINFHKALAVNGQNPLLKFILYHNIAEVHGERGELKESLRYLNKFVPQAQRMLGEDYFELTRAYQVMGINYRKLKQYDKSYELHHKSLLICQKAFGENHLKVAEAYDNLGMLFMAQENYAEAQYYFEKSLAIYLNIFDHQSHKVAKAYFINGKNLFLNKQYEQANESLQKASIANRLLGEKDEEYYFDIDLQIQILDYSCRSFYHENRNKNNNDDSWEHDLVQMYQDIDAKIAANRDALNNYKDKIEFSKVVTEVYAKAIQYLSSLKVKNKDELSEIIFLFAEKSRANTLKDLLVESNAFSFSGIDNNLLEFSDELRIEKAYYISKKLKASDSLTKKNYQDKIFDITKRQDSFNLAIEKNYPKYYQLKHKNKVISLSEIQKKLNKKTTLVEFFTTDSSVYAFTISKNKMAVKNIKAVALSKQIEGFRKAITSENNSAYKKIARTLSEMIIDPIKESFVGDQLVIIPHGPLWHLNFDLLLTQESISNEPVDLPYLMKDYAISYANSATLFFNPFQKANVATKREACLAFSFSDSTNNSTAKNMSLATLRNTDDDLPGTREEIRAISELIDGEYFFGNTANEGAFKKNAGKYDILHLALHGEIDNEYPENSKLYFTKSNDSIEDDVLYSHELFALNIPAELTVLSACNTGTGKIVKGEGIMSLGNAFQYAGTKSLVLSSWEVSDKTTPQLMKYFYTNLKNGMNKAKALQQAKLAYLQSADQFYKAPFYWGSFYLVGDTSSIHFHRSSLSYWILGSLTAISMLLLLFFMNNRNRRKNKRR